METNGNKSNSNENQPSDASNIDRREKLTEKEVFINHGMSLCPESTSARKYKELVLFVRNPKFSFLSKTMNLLSIQVGRSMVKR